MVRLRDLLVAGGLAAAALPGVLAAQTQAPSPVAATPAATETAPGAGAGDAAAAAASAPGKAATPAPAAAAGGAAPAAKTPIPEFYRPTPGVGQPTDRIGLQPQETDNGRYAMWFHNAILLPLITVICLFVLALLLWVVVFHNRRTNPTPSRNSHNTPLEVVWTLAPVLILVAIAVPSIKLLARQYDTPKPDITVKVIGHQWYWSYQYPDNGDFEVVSNMLSKAEADKRGEPHQLAVDERMVVPAGKVVKVITTSDDVIHAFAVPAFWTKIDAVPGRLNETWFKVERPGVYYGQCSELCGARHGFMPIAVEVVTAPQFAQWVAARGGTLKGAPTSSDATANSPVSNPPATTAEPGSAGAAGNAATVDATAAAPATSQPATAQNQ